MERLDDLILGGFQLWQDPEGVCFGIDAILLGHFASHKPNARYADLGTGTGAIAHVLVARGVRQVVAFEIQERLATLASRSVIHNGLEEHIQVIHGDYRTAYREGFGGSFDAIVVNPPYFLPGKGKISSEIAQQVARHETETSLHEVVQSAKRLLRFGGNCYMVYRAKQLTYALEVLAQGGFSVKRLRMVHGRMEQPAKLVLMEAKLGGKPGLIIEAPLCVYDTPGVYSQEVAQWYQKG